MKFCYLIAAVHPSFSPSHYHRALFIGFQVLSSCLLDAYYCFSASCHLPCVAKRKQKKVAYNATFTRQNGRSKAVRLLTEISFSVPQIRRETEVSNTMVYTMKKYLMERKETELSRILNPGCNRPGRSRILTVEEEYMISHRLVNAARRGFPMDVDNLRILVSKVVADGRKVPLGFPTLDAGRSFRTRHYELTYRKTEKQGSCKDSC